MTATWPAAAGHVTLTPNQVHVVRALLDVPADDLARLAESLSADERARAARFRLPCHQARALATRGYLRAILGRYTGLAPASLRFAAGRHGKPYLVGPAGPAALRFNLAHSEQLLLVALAWNREVGVDVERERDDRVDIEVARRVLGEHVAEHLATLSAPARTRAFFALWTLHEAAVKGTGGGLGDDGDGAARGGFSVRELEIDDGFAAAVAVQGGAEAIRCWTWTLPRTSTP